MGSCSPTPPKPRETSSGITSCCVTHDDTVSTGSSSTWLVMTRDARGGRGSSTDREASSSRGSVSPELGLCFSLARLSLPDRCGDVVVRCTIPRRSRGSDGVCSRMCGSPTPSSGGRHVVVPTLDVVTASSMTALGLGGVAGVSLGAGNSSTRVGPLGSSPTCRSSRFFFGDAACVSRTLPIQSRVSRRSPRSRMASSLKRNFDARFFAESSASTDSEMLDFFEAMALRRLELIEPTRAGAVAGGGTGAWIETMRDGEDCAVDGVRAGSVCDVFLVEDTCCCEHLALGPMTNRVTSAGMLRGTVPLSSSRLSLALPFCGSMALLYCFHSVERSERELRVLLFLLRLRDERCVLPSRAVLQRTLRAPLGVGCWESGGDGF
eukprot:PhM_4_TR7175/c0_g2_i1/m.27744